LYIFEIVLTLYVDGLVLSHFCRNYLFLISNIQYLTTGFGFVSGLQTQGYRACSTCGPSLGDMAKYSSHLHKIVYLGHTKFLPLGHDMRSDPLLFSSFDMPYGDERDIPEATTFAYWMDIANRVADPNNLMVFEGTGLTRWGILNSLPYWGELKICHLLDPMHIEGNVGKAIIKQLYGEKDNNFRKAYKALERHPDVWISVDPIIGSEQRPSAPWTLTTRKRKEF
jgi:hypothetical protein